MALALRAVSMPRCVTSYRPTARTPVVVVRAGLWNDHAGVTRMLAPSPYGRPVKPCRAENDEGASVTEKTKEAGSEAMSNVKSGATDAKEAVQDKSSEAKDAVQDKTSEAKGAAKEGWSDVKENASDMGDKVKGKTDEVQT
ncbi:hypothetical protein FOA52_003230 [Chlamydomonas sp. UWO 241]|nr:hypothetical protein FOA52_003230 [Chlamydomonas sp. UWO 241]